MFEIIGVTLEEVILIEELGATQVELISGFAEGGLTPSYGLIEKSVNSVNIPLNVMIRPHSRSFTYSKYDLEVMREDAIIMYGLGIKNVVLGVLDERGLPDLKALEYILSPTDLTATFHRAFDSSTDLLKSLEILNTYPRVKSILTSGGEGRASDNLKMLKRIIENRKDISILVGSGVTLENMEAINKELNNPNYHIGTAVRNGHWNNPVDKDQLSKAVKIYKGL